MDLTPHDRPRNAEDRPQSSEDRPQSYSAETYNHWSIVNLVFHHLAAQGLHPVLGGPGNPGEAAADLLRALGIEPMPEGNRKVADEVKQRLADLRAAAFDGA